MGSILLAVLVSVAALAVWEMRTSTLQARYFTERLEGASFSVEDGPSETLLFPEHGPYDVRLGYTRIEAAGERLDALGYELTSQARWSPRFQEIVAEGAFPPYVEKRQAGLAIIDAGGEPLYFFSVPREVYLEFEDIPPPIVDSLLFVENRSLLDLEPATRNPAIEWSRLANAVVENGLEVVGFGSDRPSGGSTLATQIEKFRHSPGGRTANVEQKLQQMYSASLRAYLHGPDTAEARKRIVLDYVNGVPLSANPQMGEVFGLRDALTVWFGADPSEVDDLLFRGDVKTWQDKEARGLALRRALTLILSQRRPSELLLQRRDALDEITDSHLRVMRAEGVIPMALADEALDTRSLSIDIGELPEPTHFREVKTQNAVRAQLRELVGEPSLHSLDRMDLEVQSTIELSVQEAIKAKLHGLDDPKGAEEMNLVGHRLLKDDAKGIVFGLTLYERTPYGSALRLQVDTYDQPLNINEGIKLDLGSTAKLRTMTTYLEIVAELHDELSGMTPEARRDLVIDSDDVLTKWVWDQLRKDPRIELEELLEAAMNRTYSASPAETFFTGGGAHRFGNFDKADNSKRVTAREAFQRSINLPFVRMMREIVRYYVPQLPNAGPTLFTDPEHPGRRARLETFANTESREFLQRFYANYRGTSAEEALDRLVARRSKWTPVALATALRSAAPDLGFEAFSDRMRGHLDARKLTDEKLRKLYDDHGPGKFDWNDRGYLTRLHPLELWLVAHRRTTGEPRWTDAAEASAQVRREVYEWLFKPKRFKAQNKRLRYILEREAFERIHREWARLGYPFEELTPSLASSIGAAADRPDALARLVGIIAGGGLAYERYVASSFHFGVGTPYETRYERRPHEPVRVMNEAVARRLRSELVGVVREGTAKRLRRAEPYKSDPLWLVGGKTGTGDHRKRKTGRGGRVLEETPVSRSATFVFFLGDRFHGTLTAFVEGPAAADHEFTSSLPVTILRELAPELEPIVGRSKRKGGRGVEPDEVEVFDGVIFYDDLSADREDDGWMPE